MSAINSGFWINWEHGALKGATLTLPTYYGLILVSFLTLFVQFAGGCFWRTLCFILHQTRSTTSARDGLYHQQQIILRNAITAPNALWSLGRSAVVWKSRVATPLSRSLPLLFITILHIACFAAAGLLSSQIASTRAGQALVDSRACGYSKKLSTIRSAYSRDLTEEQLNVFNAQVVLGRFTLTKSAAYVRSCYNGDSKGVADCSHFVRQNLMGEQAAINMTAACPFGSNACLTDAVRYDTGLLNSNKDIGINSPPSDSVSFRRVTTCAPIRVDDYATEWRDGLPEAYGNKTTTKVKFYEFGEGDTGCTATSEKVIKNTMTTFCISEWMQDYLPGAYLVAASTAYAEEFNASDFNPISDFQVSNADVTLISIFNKAEYTGRVDDLLYNAQILSNRSEQFYKPTHELAVLGCTEQYQFCNPNTRKCTKLSGLYAVQNSTKRGDLALSKRQQATFSVMWEAAWGMVLQWTVKLLNNRVLLAQDWVFTATSTGSSSLPADQWQRESFNLHNLSLAMFQHRLNQYAAPDTFEISHNVSALDQLDTPTDPDLLDICNRQRVLSARHYSVSVLGMAIILSVGTFLIILDQSMEALWFRYINARWRLEKRAEWTQTGTLQLHRQALEARGIGTWDRKNHDFPVIEGKGKTFTGLGAREESIGQIHGSPKVQYGAVTDEIPLTKPTVRTSH